MDDENGTYMVPVLKNHDPSNFVEGMLKITRDCQKRLATAIKMNEDVRATFGYIRDNDTGEIQIVSMDFTVPGLLWDDKCKKHIEKEPKEAAASVFKMIREMA